MTTLSRETITQAALRIVDAKGLNALSMRQLGRRLGVDAKAVYYYFPSKEALVAGVLETAFDELQLPAQLSGTWQAQLRQIVAAYYALVTRHPNLLPYLMTFDGSVPSVFRIVERIVAALKDTGLSGRSIAQIVDLFASFVPGFALAEQREESTSEQVYRQIVLLPDGEFPATKAMIARVAEDDLEEDFDFQLNIVLMGIEALIEKGSEANP